LKRYGSATTTADGELCRAASRTSILWKGCPARKTMKVIKYSPPSTCPDSEEPQTDY
jgi:hypothetical protein